MSDSPDEGRIGFREKLLGAVVGVLGEEKAQVALQFWDRNYAADKPQALIEFVSEISGVLGLQTRERHEIRLALYKMQTGRLAVPARQLASNLLNARVEEMLRIAPPASEPAPAINGKAPAAFQVFETLCQHLHSAAMAGGKVTPRQVADHMYRTLIVDYDKDLEADAFVKWTGGQNDLGAVRGADVVTLSLYLRKFVAVLNQRLGDAATQRLVNEALAAAERTTAAQQFPPRQLL